MNFEWDGKLAERQDLFLSGKSTTEDHKAFRRNWMVKIAGVLAPCNLTVRHLCILDILDGRPSRYTKVLHQFRVLTYGGLGLWAESYSYWGYTRWALRMYAERFGLNYLNKLIMLQDNDFAATGYLKDGHGQLSAAPFGDLWPGIVVDTPGYVERAPAIYPVTWIPPDARTKVWIKSRGIGFNLHTAYVDTVYEIVSGEVKGFHYYEGYAKKYPTKWKEILALGKRALDLIFKGG